MDISYRERTREDRKGVIRLAISAFGVAVRPFFSLGEAGHVAESNGRIVGATVLKTFTVGGRRFGEVGWIMVARDARGQGIAGRLYHLAEEWFRARQVTDLVAIIEGYNQSSSKLFAGNGFERISLRKQLEQFGLAAPVVRFKTTLFMAFGHYLWHRSLNAATDNAMDSATEDAKPEVDSGHGEAAGASPVTSWLSAWVLHAFIMAILLVRWGVGGPLNMRVIAVVVTPALLLGVRWAAFAAAARGFGLHLRYRAWDGGMGLALLISAVFGGFISVPGSH
jgi:RimJ/RimL family protein N-acetyltransferase